MYCTLNIVIILKKVFYSKKINLFTVVNEQNKEN